MSDRIIRYTVELAPRYALRRIVIDGDYKRDAVVGYFDTQEEAEKARSEFVPTEGFPVEQQ
jgi:metallophosphoesterase superfamily enzyme